MAKVGFIGLGNMGLPMAQNLLKADYAVTGFDLNAHATERLEASGGRGANSLADACKDVEVVITMLPAGEQVCEVYLGDEGVLAAVAPGTLLIDSSTIDVETARAVHAAAAERGYAMLDAPVSGGVVGADAATLTFMCGGDKAAFQRALPLLQGMGKNILHCGAPGFGQVTKICNNMIAGITVLAVAEAFVMGEKLGVERQALYDALSTSTASSFILNKSCPMPGPVAGSASSNGFKPGFCAKLMLKDLRLSQSAAQVAGTPTPLGAAATAAFAMHIAKGFGDLDMSSIVKLINPNL